jgi:metal-sulfur cluster biosynthetic enzyme
MTGERFAYRGDAATRPLVERALHRVIDPEMSLDIVELGLVYGVEVDERGIDVRITMTSAACPVAELIMADVEEQLKDELGDDTEVRVDLVWEPPWGPERMSQRARHAMDWD